MECEMCGRVSGLLRAKIEGSVLQVCRKCGSLGEILQEEKPQKAPVKAPAIEQQEIVPDFPALIKQAMKERSLSRKELAERIKEKESIIRRVENGMRPTKQIAEKLEKALGIQILGYEEKEQKIPAIKTDELTVGDIIEIRMRKKA